MIEKFFEDFMGKTMLGAMIIGIILGMYRIASEINLKVAVNGFLIILAIIGVILLCGIIGNIVIWLINKCI